MCDKKNTKTSLTDEQIKQIDANHTRWMKAIFEVEE